MFITTLRRDDRNGHRILAAGINHPDVLVGGSPVNKGDISSVRGITTPRTHGHVRTQVKCTRPDLIPDRLARIIECGVQIIPLVDVNNIREGLAPDGLGTHHDDPYYRLDVPCE